MCELCREMIHHLKVYIILIIIQKIWVKKLYAFLDYFNIEIDEKQNDETLEDYKGKRKLLMTKRRKNVLTEMSK